MNAALRRHGIPRRPEPQAAPPPLELDRTTLTDLYVTRRLDDTAIGAMHGVPAYRVTLRRRELGVGEAQLSSPFRSEKQRHPRWKASFDTAHRTGEHVSWSTKRYLAELTEKEFG